MDQRVTRDGEEGSRRDAFSGVLSGLHQSSDIMRR